MERKPTCPIADIFINRVSSRAYSDEPLTDAQLMPLFEAARWAPSAHNEQPWRFIYAHKGSKAWDIIFSTIEPVNQIWAQNAAVLVVVLSKNKFSKVDAANAFHTFDTGAACMSLALQATLENIIVHAIGGFAHEHARKILHIPADYSIDLILALGKLGDKTRLPEKLQAREQPTQRKELDEIVFKDGFKA